MARYRPQDPRDYLAAIDFINRAKEQNIEIELRKYYPKRTSKQNKYLFFCISYFAHIYGCTIEESKEVFFKRYANRDLFEVDKTDSKGKQIHYFRSTADLTTAEMASAIRNFVAYTEMNGVMIPDPEDDTSIRYCERQMESSNGWI